MSPPASLVHRGAALLGAEWCRRSGNGYHDSPAATGDPRSLPFHEKEDIGLEPGFSVLREAVPAVNGSAFGRLEGDFALFPAVRADGLRHFTGAAEVSRAAEISVSSVIIHWIAHADRTLPVKLRGYSI